MWSRRGAMPCHAMRCDAMRCRPGPFRARSSIGVTRTPFSAAKNHGDSDSWRSAVGALVLFSALALIARAHGDPPPANSGGTPRIATAGLINAGKPGSEHPRELRHHDRRTSRCCGCSDGSACATSNSIKPGGHANRRSSPPRRKNCTASASSTRRARADAAFESLGKTEATRRIDMTMIQATESRRPA